MARQKGIFPIQGSIGNVTFFKSKDGYLARERGGVDANKIATAPEFQRTRENNAEFGRAGKAGKLLREAFRVLILSCSDKGLVGRIVALMLQVIKLDATSIRGQRNVLDGELEFLQGLEFNTLAKLSSVFYAPYSAAIDRVTGNLTLSIPMFNAAQMVSIPQGATHFKVHAGGAAIDFENNVMESKTDSSIYLDTTSTAVPAISLAISLSANSTHPLFLALAIEFYQKVNNSYYSLKNGIYNSMALIKVEGI
jgi:hypothetical protein